MYIAWGPQFVQFYNDAAAPALSAWEGQMIGRPARDTFADGWRHIAPHFEHVLTRGEAATIRTRLPSNPTSSRAEREIVLLCSPVAQENAVGGVLVTLQSPPKSATRKRRSHIVRDLRESEERLNFALTAGQLGYWELDLTTRHLFNSDLYRANWGRAPGEDFTYATLLRSIHPDDREEHERKVDEAIAARTPLDIEYRAIWPDGSVHWLRVRGRAVYDAASRKPLRMAGISLDVTDRKRAERSLLAETQTLETLNRVGMELVGDLDVHRIVQTVTDAATEITGAQFGAFFYNVLDERGESYTLYTLSGVAREAFAKFPMPRNTAVFDFTFQGKGSFRSDDIRKDPRYGHNAPHHGLPKGHPPVASYLAVPVVSRDGEVLGGLFFGHEKEAVFTDRAERIVAGMAAQAAMAIDNARLFQSAQAEIADRRRAEAQLKLLLAELNHRVKNTLAIVQSIASQTLHHADSAEVFRSGFEARVMALAQAHDLLTESNWEGASMRTILERVLSPYSTPARRRYKLRGDDVSVDPKTAVSLVLAFHELATNAAKYGSLSNASGHVQVTWRMIEGKEPAALTIAWEEFGGPRVQPPLRRGFGSRLIQNLSHETGGEVRLDFDPSGLVCRFDMPLSTGHYP